MGRAKIVGRRNDWEGPEWAHVPRRVVAAEEHRTVGGIVEGRMNET